MKLLLLENVKIKGYLMKYCLFILLNISVFIPQLYSQESNDSIFIFRDEDKIFIFGGEDNWENAELYKTIIHNKIDSVVKENKNIFDQICEKLIIRFAINDKGKVDSCEIMKSINNEIDSLVINTICNLDFKNAAVYSSSGEPYSIRFTLPIRFDGCPVNKRRKL